jgi:hypothetical protein
MMPAGFDAAFARVKELVGEFRVNENFYLSPAFHYIGIISEEIEIVEGLA